jgi:hypothetical protein
VGGDAAMHRRSGEQLLSGGGAGDIKLWDVRGASSAVDGGGNSCVRTLISGHRDMSALAVHPRAPILATGRCAARRSCVRRQCESHAQTHDLSCGSCAQELRVHNFEKDIELATIRFHGAWTRMRVTAC